MTELVFKGMKGIEPVLDQCLHEGNVADIAHNVKLWHGRLDPWRAPLLCKSVLNACAAHVRDCCWRTSEDPCTRFVDILCGPTIISSPTTLPAVIEDFCDENEQICPLGFPCPDQPVVTQNTSSAECHMSELRAYLIAYGDECLTGAPSPMSTVFTCANKDDKFTLTLPPPPATYCNVTKIYIYRLAATLDMENGHNHPSREHRAQGDTTLDANDADCFLVGCVDVGETTFCDQGGVLESQICESIISEDWDAPPCGLVIHGMFDSGALVGSIGDKLMFSEFNTHHAWPCKYELTMECEIITVCVCDTFAFVFTTGGISIVRDDLEAMETFCRPKVDIKRPLPICNHKAVVCSNGQAIFASKNGIYRVDSTGQVQNLTDRIGVDNWLEMDPASMRLGLYDGRIMMTSDRFSGVYDIDIYGDGTPASNTLSTIDPCPQCWINDKQGNLYMLGSEGISQWDKGEQYMDMHWRTAEKHYPGFGFLTAAKIQHALNRGRKVKSQHNTHVAIYADGCKVFEREVRHNEPFRVPKCRAHSYAIEIRGRRSVASATLAASIRCMGVAA